MRLPIASFTDFTNSKEQISLPKSREMRRDMFQHQIHKGYGQTDTATQTSHRARLWFVYIVFGNFQVPVLKNIFIKERISMNRCLTPNSQGSL